MTTKKQIINNFKYLHFVIKSYYIIYPICRKKRFLFLKNYHEIKHLHFFLKTF